MEKEPGRTLVQSLCSEFGEGTGPDPGWAGSEFGKQVQNSEIRSREKRPGLGLRSGC